MTTAEKALHRLVDRASAYIRSKQREAGTNLKTIERLHNEAAQDSCEILKALHKLERLEAAYRDEED